jgi:hypothetical protein
VGHVQGNEHAPLCACTAGSTSGRDEWRLPRRIRAGVGGVGGDGAPIIYLRTFLPSSWAIDALSFA